MSKEKILVVEDAPDIHSLLKIYFTSQGYEVMTAMRGQIALDICRKTPPNLALLDVNLPDMEGYYIGKTLRQSVRTRHIPIIFLTARGEKQDRIKGLGEVQAEYYLVKPFDIEEVHTIVKGTLDRARQKNLAHPVTNLPTAELINDQYRNLVASAGWALAQAHINGFETFTRAYGAVVGEDVLKFTALLLNEVINELGSLEDFIGQMVVGPDFVITSTPRRIRAVCMKLCERFDAEIGLQYNYKDRRNGYITVNDEQGNPRQVPLMSLSIGVLTSDDGPFHDIRELSETVEDTRQGALAEARELGRKSYVCYGRNAESPIDDKQFDDKDIDEFSEVIGISGSRDTIRLNLSHADLVLLKKRVFIQNIARQSAISLVAVNVIGSTKSAQALYENKIIVLPELQEILDIGMWDLLATVPTELVDQSIAQMIDHFYEHPLVQQNSMVLSFGYAHGSYDTTDELIDTVARDMLERRHSQGITATHEPAILTLQPQRPSLQQSYKRLRRRYTDCREEIKVQNSDEYHFHDEVRRLTAIVDHDLSSGLASIKSIIRLGSESVPALSTQTKSTLTRLDTQIAICAAWQRSIAQLGSTRVLQPQLIDIGSKLESYLGLLHHHLQLPFAIEIADIHGSQQTKVDPQTLLVACLHLLLATQTAGATKLHVRADFVQHSGHLTITFEDDGHDPLRPQALQAQFAFKQRTGLPWHYQNLALLRAMLQPQNIIVSCEQTDKHFRMIWNISLEQPTSHLMFMALAELKREIAQLEREVARLEKIIKIPIKSLDAPPSDQVEYMLRPYALELEHSLSSLINRTSSLTSMDELGTAIAQRIRRLSRYCYLLVRNLVLALHESDKLVFEQNLQIFIKQYGLFGRLGGNGSISNWRNLRLLILFYPFVHKVMSALHYNEQSAEHISSNHYINRLLDLMHSTHQVELPIEHVNINEQIHEVCALLEHKMIHVKIFLHLMYDLPPAYIAFSDAQLILFNLIKNSVEATKMSGEMHITTKLWHGKIVIEIKDTGSGIQSTDWGNIFELNYSTKGKGKQAGLGLYVVQSIVRRVAGQIRIASATESESIPWKRGFNDIIHWAGTGTIVRVEIPVAKER